MTAESQYRLIYISTQDSEEFMSTAFSLRCTELTAQTAATRRFTFQKHGSSNRV